MAARFIAQLLVSTSSIVIRAFAQAYREAARKLASRFVAEAIGLSGRCAPDRGAGAAAGAASSAGASSSSGAANEAAGAIRRGGISLDVSVVGRL